MDLIKLMKVGAERGRQRAIYDDEQEREKLMTAAVEATNVNYVGHFRSNTSKRQKQQHHKTSSTINRLVVGSSCCQSAAAAATTRKTTRSLKTTTRFSHANNIQQESCSRNSVAYWLALGAFVALLFFFFFSSSSSSLVNAARLQPEGQNKFYWSGENFVITCQNNNNLKNVRIRWAGPDGKPITEDRSRRVHAESGGPHVNRLVVRDAQLDQDQGQYVCTISDAENRRSPDRANFTLNLLRATSFMDTRSKLALDTGKEEHIECRVEFDPNVSSGTVNWYKDHQPIDAHNDTSIRVLDYNPDTKTSKLVLSPVRREHQGNYTCQAQAVAAHLEKLLDFAIQVETQFAPIFDASEQTIWVESSQAMQSRGAGSAAHSHAAQHNKYKSTSSSSSSSSSRPQMRPSKGRLGESELSEPTMNLNNETIIRVELKCSCQANPSANIWWYTESVGSVAVTRGQPAHVIEEPTTQLTGQHESQSTLVVAYNLDLNWPHRYDTYKCSAANKLNGASKTYTIVQGNPPPAFTVGAHKSYNPQTSEFQFTLMAPNFDPQSGGSGAVSRGEFKDVLPPVDAFRIRAEFATSAADGATGSGSGSGSGKNTAANNRQAASAEMARRQAEPSVEWAASILRPSSASQQQQIPATDNNNNNNNNNSPHPMAQNMSIKLGKLPSGLQRLYLEAHNAVGWSPNSTLLGEFNLISGATPSAHINSLLMLTCLCLLTLLSRLNNNNNNNY